uniref:Mono-/di-acylglycerol lipase N-terminal domain-containing protein n=1 Tax=Ananas comosus var. bracteatus TaxID=296719 RepID=A0A6V7P7E5_ANACO|nr:unnamed protein product [Ananas comosus var. bracteatus]
MSVSCGLECVVCFGCTRWAWKRLTYIGAYDSETWPAATPEEFEPIPRICRVILAVYEDDLSRPRFPPPAATAWTPPASSSAPPTTTPAPTAPLPPLPRPPPPPAHPRHPRPQPRPRERLQGPARQPPRAPRRRLRPPRPAQGRRLDPRPRVRRPAPAAARPRPRPRPRLRRPLARLRDRRAHGPPRRRQPRPVRGIPRSRVRCYAIAPARCMSLNLAVKYADVVNSVVLQANQQLHITFNFTPGLCTLDSLPCLLFFVCMRDTFIPEKKKLSDPKRLYAPGRMYHIVERKFCRCGRYPPEVRTAIPVEGRFEHIVLSCNATSDHGIVWIEREAEKALELMKEIAKATTPHHIKRWRGKRVLNKSTEVRWNVPTL